MEDNELTPDEKMIKDLQDNGSIFTPRNDSQINFLTQTGLNFDALQTGNSFDSSQLGLTANPFTLGKIESQDIHFAESNLIQQMIYDNSLNTVNPNLFLDSGAPQLEPTTSSLNLFDVEPVEDSKDKEIRELKEKTSQQDKRLFEQDEKITDLIEKVEKLQTKPKKKTRVKSSIDKELKKETKYIKHYKRTCDDIAKDTSLV